MSQRVEVDEAFAAVCAALTVVLPVDPTALRRSTRLDEIGADSLARVELAELVEARLGRTAPGRRIPDEALARFDTLGDVVDHLVATA